MDVQVLGFHHVKLPVTDVATSAAWYQSLLELDLIREFVEEGVLRGVALFHRQGRFVVTLRDREVCAGKPDLAGFDPCALRVGERTHLDALARRCDELGVRHGEIEQRSSDEAVLDVRDPDDTVLRFIWITGTDEAYAFVGLVFDETGVRTYHTPRLS